MNQIMSKTTDFNEISFVILEEKAARRNWKVEKITGRATPESSKYNIRWFDWNSARSSTPFY